MDKCVRTPPRFAAWKGRTEREEEREVKLTCLTMVIKCLTMVKYPGQMFDHGQTPPRFAAWKGRAEAAAALLELRLTMVKCFDQMSKCLTTPRFAAWKGNAEAAAALLELGADVNASDPDGWCV